MVDTPKLCFGSGGFHGRAQAAIGIHDGRAGYGS